MERIGGAQESFESKLKRIDEIGSPLANNHYPAGWAQVGNTPLKWYKSFVHAGGVKDPLIIHYPDKIKDAGAIRGQYHHVIDIVPTILELLNIEAPSVLKGVPQKPIEGVSMAYTFDDGKLPTRKEVQYYEMVGNRAIYYKGWKAVAVHKPDTPFEEDSWELYRVDEDYSEMNDLAGQNPGILRDLIDRWWVEAGKYGVLPLDGRSLAGIIRARKQIITQPAGPVRRKYYPSSSRFHASVAPDLRSKSFEIRVPLSRHSSGEAGVLIAQGDGSGGYTLYIQDNRLVFHYNYSGVQTYTVSSDQELPAGSVVLRLLMLHTGDNEGTVKMFIEDRQIGEGAVGHTGFLGFSGGPFQIGRDDQSAVSPAYTAPFAFTGTIDHVAITLGAYDFDLEAAVTRELATE